ncbi:acyltransferase [Parabacteroides sp.]
MRSLFRYLMVLIMPLLPETRCFGFKRWLLRQTGARIGENVRICSSALFIGAGLLEIGDNTWVGHRCTICSSSHIKIGANCDLAPNVYVGNGTHEITPCSARIADIEISKDITVGDGCWLCVNSTILPGVCIAPKCVVAAGAVVTRSVEKEAVLLAGIPAEIKKEILNTGKIIV